MSEALALARGAPVEMVGIGTIFPTPSPISFRIYRPERPNALILPPTMRMKRPRVLPIVTYVGFYFIHTLLL